MLLFRCQSWLQITRLCYVTLQVLTYTAGHINYGGRVTDDWDRRCLMNILAEFYNPDVLKTDYQYSQSGTYKQLDPDNDYSVSTNTHTR